jgi:HSP20 family protein
MTDKKTGKSRPTEDEDSTGLALYAGRSLAGLFDDLFRPFDEFFPASMRSFIQEGVGVKQPIIDVQDRGDHFSLTAELPGFDKNEVEVKVASNGVELRAEKTEKSGQSTSSCSYYQFVSLPSHVQSERVDGTMKNGILELKIPKKAQLKDNARRVDLR